MSRSDAEGASPPSSTAGRCSTGASIYRAFLFAVYHRARMNSARAARQWPELPWQFRQIRGFIGDDTVLLRQGIASVGKNPDKAYQALSLMFPVTLLYALGGRAPRLRFAVAQRSRSAHCVSPCREDENVYRWRVAIALRLRALAGFGAGGRQCLFLFHAHPDAAPPGAAAALDLHSDRLGAGHRRSCVRHFALVAHGADPNRHRTSVARLGFQKAAAENRLSRKASHRKRVRFSRYFINSKNKPITQIHPSTKRIVRMKGIAARNTAACATRIQKKLVAQNTVMPSFLPASCTAMTSAANGANVSTALR